MPQHVRACLHSPVCRRMVQACVTVLAGRYVYIFIYIYIYIYIYDGCGLIE